MVDIVGQRDLAQRLTSSHTPQRFARLMLGQLRPATEPRALGHGAGAALVSPLQDQVALELRVGLLQRPQRSCMSDRGAMDRHWLNEFFQDF